MVEYVIDGGRIATGDLNMDLDGVGGAASHLVRVDNYLTSQVGSNKVRQ